MTDSDIHMNTCHHCGSDAVFLTLHGLAHCIACAVANHHHDESD